MNENNPLKEINFLFPNIQSSDVVEHFLAERTGAFAIKNNKKIKLKLNETVENNLIKLKPTGRERYYTGKKTIETLIHIYNEDYWLIELWNSMIAEQNLTVISREIIRAFIKHCISTTAEYIINLGVDIIDSNSLKSYARIKSTKYYKKILSLSSILKEMRYEQRKRMAEIINKNPKEVRNFNYEEFSSVNYQLNYNNLVDLFNSNNLSRFSSIIRTVDELNTIEDPNVIITGIVEVLILYYRFVRDRGKLRRSLRNTLLGSNREK